MQSLFFLFSCFFLILFLHKYAIFVFSSPVCTFFLSIFFLQEYADAIYVISLLFFFVLFCLLCILFLHIIAPQPLHFSLYILFIHECAIGALFSLFCKFLLVLHLIPIEITSVLFSLFVHLCILCILFLHEHGTWNLCYLLYFFAFAALLQKRKSSPGYTSDIPKLGREIRIIVTKKSRSSSSFLVFHHWLTL